MDAQTKEKWVFGEWPKQGLEPKGQTPILHHFCDTFCTHLVSPGRAFGQVGGGFDLSWLNVWMVHSLFDCSLTELGVSILALSLVGIWQDGSIGNLS